MSYKMYKLLSDSKIDASAKAGMTAYDIRGYDYGLARDDTDITGIHHISVTLSDDGGYPSFTIPVSDLEVIGDAPFYTDMIAARKAGG